MTGVGWLDEAEKRAATGTWGKWRVEVGDDGQQLVYSDKGPLVAGTGRGEISALDAEFIAASRSSLPRAVAALRAVLDLHRPKPDDAADAGHCTGCDSLWPCPTVAAIEAAS